MTTITSVSNVVQLQGPPPPRFGELIRGAQIGEILITISVVFIGYRNREIPDTLVMF